LRVRKLNGMSVITFDAYVLGEVEGTHADTLTWLITDLDISLTKEATKELGFKKPVLGSLSICLPVSNVLKVADVITLTKSLSELKKLKECKAE
jgi:sporulation protein YlmC with PRC-barrel domain